MANQKDPMGTPTHGGGGTFYSSVIVKVAYSQEYQDEAV
jgi:hypothetical protein